MPIDPKTLLAALLLAAPAAAQETDNEYVGARAVGNIVNLAGENIGSVVAAETESGLVLITIQAIDLDPGTHGVHIHETGSCADEFAAAGGHIADGMEHGLIDGGPHPGDLPNGFVGDDGVLSMQAFNSRLTVASLLEGDGSALIIHADLDDYISQPGGSSGDRVACAVLDSIPAALDSN
jgi:Cu-Zn family superoxide dismutase